jgi:ABC-type branched-subunit amino acid transport system substrate-binding protein
MRGINRRTFLVGTGALAVGARAARAQTERVIRVGMILPISGNLAQYAANMFPPFRYVVDKINEDGGIKSMGGAKIELVVADNASGSAGTASEARRLISQEKVSFIAGPLVTSEMLALVPVLDEFKVPALSFTSGDSRSKYLFSIGLTYEKGYAAPPIDFLTYLIKEKQRNIRSVALVYSNYEAGQQIANYQEKMITAAGLTVAARIPVDRTAQDQTSTILRIKSAKPDAVTGLVLTREGVLMQQARANLRYNDTTFVGCGAGYADVTLWTELGPKLAGQVLTRNLFATNGFVADIKLPAAKAIVAELQKEIDAKRIQGPVGHYQVWGAQGARLMQAAFELAGSNDREALKGAFEKVKLEQGNPFLYLPRRELAFGQDNCLTDQTALALQWLPDGGQQAIWPTKFARAEPRPFQ